MPESRPIGPTCPAALGSTRLMPSVCSRSLGYSISRMCGRPGSSIVSGYACQPSGRQLDPSSLQMLARLRRAAADGLRRQVRQAQRRGQTDHPLPPFGIGGIEFQDALPVRRLLVDRFHRGDDDHLHLAAKERLAADERGRQPLGKQRQPHVVDAFFQRQRNGQANGRHGRPAASTFSSWSSFQSCSSPRAGRSDAASR